MSSAIETIHEVSAEQVLQDASVIFNAIHPEDLPIYSAAVQASTETLSTFSLQWRIITRSGQVKWVQGKSQPQRRPRHWSVKVGGPQKPLELRISCIVRGREMNPIAIAGVTLPPNPQWGLTQL